MKINVDKYNDLHIDTEGWMLFGDFIGQVINTINESKLGDKAYLLCSEADIIGFYNDDDSLDTLELGTFLISHCNHLSKEIANIGIRIKPVKGKREFTILGVDFWEAEEICSITGVHHSTRTT